MYPRRPSHRNLCRYTSMWVYQLVYAGIQTSRHPDYFTESVRHVWHTHTHAWTCVGHPHLRTQTHRDACPNAQRICPCLGKCVRVKNNVFVSENMSVGKCVRVRIVHVLKRVWEICFIKINTDMRTNVYSSVEGGQVRVRTCTPPLHSGMHIRTHVCVYLPNMFTLQGGEDS